MREEPAPFFQVALGRSGTTAAMRLFSAHPQIVAHPAYPLELRAFAFAHHPGDEGLLKGARHYRDLAPFSEADRAAIDAGRAPDAEAVRALYRRVAEEQGKTAVRFATEKYPPRLDIEAAMAADPAIRVLILVRDPRDVIASARAFDARRGYRGFLEREGDSDADLVERYAALYRRLAELRRRLPGALAVRYEDMIADPAREAGRVFAWLGLDAGPDRVARAVERAEAKKPGRHLTAPSVAETVGRWRGSLSPEMAGLIAERMTAELAAFGYPA